MTEPPVATVAPALSSSEAHLFESSEPVAPPPNAELAEIIARFDLPTTISKLKDGNYSRIALQFPDELLYASVRVVETITAALNEDIKEHKARKRVFILADTSFGSCCVDEVAAEHADADCIVHFGRACLSPTSRLPVIYVFGKDPLPDDASIEQVVEDFTSRFTDTAEKIILFSPPSLEWHLKPLKSSLESRGYNNLFISEASNDPTSAIPNHTLPVSASEYYIYHLSHPSPPLLLTLHTHFPAVHTFPSTPLSAPRILARRYALTRSVLSANIIGILVNTLSVSRYLPTISSIRKLISDSGKSSYTFVVGKVNTPKLANFEEVDVWVAVGCWEQDIVGVEGRGNDFWKPVLNVLELEVGLGKREWGGWKGGFDFLSAAGEEEVKDVEKTGNGEKAVETQATIEDGAESSEDEVDYDLLTRKLVVKPKSKSKSKPTSTQNSLPSSTSQSLTTTSSENALIAPGGVFSASAQYMQQKRTWMGLGSDWVDIGYEEGGEPIPAELEEGRGGVARVYGGEGEGVER